MYKEWHWQGPLRCRATHNIFDLLSPCVHFTLAKLVSAPLIKHSKCAHVLSLSQWSFFLHISSSGYSSNVSPPTNLIPFHKVYFNSHRNSLEPSSVCTYHCLCIIYCLSNIIYLFVLFTNHELQDSPQKFLSIFPTDIFWSLRAKPIYIVEWMNILFSF